MGELDGALFWLMTTVHIDPLNYAISRFPLKMQCRLLECSAEMRFKKRSSRDLACVLVEYSFEPPYLLNFEHAFEQFDELMAGKSSRYYSDVLLIQYSTHESSKMLFSSVLQPLDKASPTISDENSDIACFDWKVGLGIALLPLFALVISQ